MKKRNLAILIGMLTITLSGCDFSFSFPFEQSSSGSSYSERNDSHPSHTYTPSITPGAGYYQTENYSIVKDEYFGAINNVVLPSIGEQKVLVIPVVFSDDKNNINSAERNRRIADLEKAFFGAANETSWHSVASYYQESSYGKFSLTGEVTPFYEAPWTKSKFLTLSRPTSTYADNHDPTWDLLESAVSWYKSYSNSSLQEYDTNGDGFIDSVFLIYNNRNRNHQNYTKKGREVFWAYTYWDFDSHAKANTQNPEPIVYAWASYDFMYEGYGSSGIDSHTYIHEFGHVLGLDDYYSYTEGDWDAAGGVDMMDYNIVDHNAYSKFFLNWIDPIIIDGFEDEVTLQLDPFWQSGQAILINNNWNGSVFDEYLLIEFYTPGGLNEKDAQAGGYPANNLQAFTIPGIKIYHVDSRLGKFRDSNDNFISYTHTLSVGSGNYPYIAASNSKEYSEFENYKLLHLIEANGVNTFKQDNHATNTTLFKENDLFSPTQFATFFNKPNGKFNNGAEIGYNVTIQSITENKATISLSSY